eukprot:279348-Hanusia_phi.AAC.1
MRMLVTGARSKRLSELGEGAGEERLELVRLHARMELQVQLLQRSAKKLRAWFSARPVRRRNAGRKEGRSGRGLRTRVGREGDEKTGEDGGRWGQREEGRRRMMVMRTSRRRKRG